MCKVAAVSGITDKNRELVWEFMKELGSLMTYGNNDGLGYAAFDAQGKIFGEKWLRNEDAFVGASKKIIPMNTKNSYAFFGQKVKKQEATSIILHTRMATCGISIDNTHPFVDDADMPSIALIHNGVIYNHTQLTKVHSSCDSEVILWEYDYANCYEDLSNIQKVANQLSGWYTCFVLSYDKDNKPIVDMFTGSGSLSSLFVPDLGVRFYSTSIRDLVNVCEFFKMNYTKIWDNKAGDYARFDGITGKELTKGKFNPDFEVVDLKGDYTEEYWKQIFGEYIYLDGRRVR